MFSLFIIIIIITIILLLHHLAKFKTLSNRDENKDGCVDSVKLTKTRNRIVNAVDHDIAAAACSCETEKLTMVINKRVE